VKFRRRSSGPPSGGSQKPGRRRGSGLEPIKEGGRSEAPLSHKRISGVSKNHRGRGEGLSSVQALRESLLKEKGKGLNATEEGRNI